LYCAQCQWENPAEFEAQGDLSIDQLLTMI